jgi:hypothetical protein
MKRLTASACLTAIVAATVSAGDVNVKAAQKRFIALIDEATVVMKTITDKTTAETAVRKLSGLSEIANQFMQNEYLALSPEQRKEMLKEDGPVKAAAKPWIVEMKRLEKLMETDSELKAILMRTELIRSNIAFSKGGEQVKSEAAKAQVAVLDSAVKAYFVKYGNFPASLKDLLETPDGKAIVQDAKALIDPWKKEFQYDHAGPKTKKAGGVGPDIWTVTPAKQEIGNWQLKKKA